MYFSSSLHHPIAFLKPNPLSRPIHRLLTAAFTSHRLPVSKWSMLWFSQGCWPGFYFQLEFPPLGSFDPRPQGHFSSSLFPPHLAPYFGIKENSKLRLQYSPMVRLMVIMLKLLGELRLWAYGNPLRRKTPRWLLLRKLQRSKARPAGNDSRRPFCRAKAVKTSPFKGSQECEKVSQKKHQRVEDQATSLGKTRLHWQDHKLTYTHIQLCGKVAL